VLPTDGRYGSRLHPRWNDGRDGRRSSHLEHDRIVLDGQRSRRSSDQQHLDGQRGRRSSSEQLERIKRSGRRRRRRRRVALIDQGARVIRTISLAPHRVHAPSDVPSLSGRSRIGGRIREVDGPTITLVDAFGAIAVTLSDASDVEPGDLVVIEADVASGAVLAARILERSRPIAPPTRSARAEAPASELDRVERGVGRGLELRARALDAVRSYFAGEGFLEVETPSIVPSPGLDLHLDAFEVLGAPWPAFLITSPEYQMKRLLAAGVPRCFQLAHCYRRGELGSRHNPEFTMLEWYRAFADVEEVMTDTENLVRAVATSLTGAPRIATNDGSIDLVQPFDRITVGQAFEQHAGVAADEAIALATHDEDRFFRLLVECVEPALERSTHPVFLIDYPAPFASLARKKPSDPRVCERFELYVAGIEICNGFGELTCPVEQRARLVHDRAERRRRGLPEYPIDERFLSALEQGMPPSAGNALGIDRLIALAAGAPQIDDVMTFPMPWL